jgi:hypothetical protein
MSFFYVLGFLFNKIGEQEGGTDSAWKQAWREEVAQTMHAHVRKGKNNIIKKFRNRSFVSTHMSIKFTLSLSKHIIICDAS